MSVAQLDGLAEPLPGRYLGGAACTHTHTQAQTAAGSPIGVLSRLKP